MAANAVEAGLSWRPDCVTAAIAGGKACGCCCSDGSTADDDGDSYAAVATQVRTAEVISAALETQAAMLPCMLRWRLKQPCRHVARVKQPGCHVHEYDSLVILCEP